MPTCCAAATLSEERLRGPDGTLRDFETLKAPAFDDVRGAGELIARCARLGVGVALDDFGTGYASLTYFRRLPAQVIKVDISFITGMLHNSEDLAIVESVLGLAKAFGRTVVAEGAERAEQAQLLRQMECDDAQGSGISPPLPGEAVLPWLAGFALSGSWKPAENGAQVAPLLEQIARHHAALHFTAGDLLQFVQDRAPAERLEALREHLETQSRKLLQDIRQLRALAAAADHRATRRAPANT